MFPVIFYGKEPLNEPVRNELKKVFPDLFRSIETMPPPGLKN